MRNIVLLFLFTMHFSLAAQQNITRLGLYEVSYPLVPGNMDSYRSFSLSLHPDSSYQFTMVDPVTIQLKGDFSMRNDTVFFRGGLDFFKDSMAFACYNPDDKSSPVRIFFEINDKYKSIWKGPDRMYCEIDYRTILDISQILGTYYATGESIENRGKQIKLVLSSDSSFTWEVRKSTGKKEMIILSDEGKWSTEGNWIVLKGTKHFFSNDRFFAFWGFEYIMIRFDVEKGYQHIWNTRWNKYYSYMNAPIYLDCVDCKTD